MIALLGANGAGKTTTLRALSGISSPQGTVKLDGVDITNLSAAKRAGCGLAHVPQGRGTFAGFTVEENLWLGAHTVSNRAQVAQDIQTWFSAFPATRASGANSSPAVSAAASSRCSRSHAP